MGLLDGKRILVTGVLMDVLHRLPRRALAQQEGAEVVLTSFGRTMRITQTIAKRLPDAAAGDRARREQRRGLRRARRPGPRARRRPRRGAALDRLRPGVGAGRQLPQDRVGRRRDGAADLGVLAQGARRRRPAADAERRLGGRPDLRRDGRLAEVRLDGRGQGGVRVDLALPGPRPRTGGDPGQPGRRRPAAARTAAKSIPGFDEFEDVWYQPGAAGLGRADFEPAARACVALLSDWFPRTTGEIVHVDGGVHAMGA